MKAKITRRFSCYYLGEKLTFEVGAIAKGWPAKRAIASSAAVPHSGGEVAPLASPETKIEMPPEFKEQDK